MFIFLISLRTLRWFIFRVTKYPLQLKASRLSRRPPTAPAVRLIACIHMRKGQR